MKKMSKKDAIMLLDHALHGLRQTRKLTRAEVDYQVVAIYNVLMFHFGVSEKRLKQSWDRPGERKLEEL